MKATSTPWPHALVSAKASAWNLMVVGYTAATVGLLADLTTSGASETPAAVSIGTTALIGIGILLATAGMMQLRGAVARNRRSARRGLAMQSLGLIGLLLGALALQIPAIPALLVSAGVVGIAGTLATVGGFRLRNHHSDIGAPSRSDAGYLALGTALLFIGVGVILASEIGFYFVLSDVTSAVITDAGLGVSACGCVLAAYSSFVIQGGGRVTKPQVPRLPDGCLTG